MIKGRNSKNKIEITYTLQEEQGLASVQLCLIRPKITWQLPHCKDMKF